ncbi:hypothetical protein [Synechococcus sp. M16CYN]|uniref:hypothetical protein n=1 Tax=Synechococcus sp. M16CYN TaxID=3103139 RepID=UPI0032495D7F
MAVNLLLINISPAVASWICDGEELTAERFSGAVDVTGIAGGIPNSSDGTLPGDGILISWRGMTLQLPRTNNKGIPSYTDGRWWWREKDLSAPEFKERKGRIVTYECSLNEKSS